MAQDTAPEDIKHAVLFAMGVKFFEGVTRIVEVAPITHLALDLHDESGTKTRQVPHQIRLQFFFGDERAFEITIAESPRCEKCRKALSRGESITIANSLTYCGRCAP